ncbi:MAG: hypothetical protein HPY55_06605 [Firmicutes bacterium]|nr:hypothetical protein [Bacillota bacterium]
MRLSDSRELRGFVLRVCQINYPHGCSEQLLQITLQENQFMSSPAALKADIEYLEEKGYVRVEEQNSERLGISRTIVYCTAKGIDLLERNIPADPGILLPVVC